jgi:2-keto-4-pentenoate hydratase/2-oxohepta-3-ene-1,7-dioic acid hydratase in catechol pathway
MKLATFQRDGAERLGLVHSRDARLFDLAAKRALDSMLALTDAADAGLDAARELFERRGGQVDLSIDTGAAQLLAPLPGPGARPHLEHGDFVELEVENIGVLRNKVERQN